QTELVRFHEGRPESARAAAEAGLAAFEAERARLEGRGRARARVIGDLEERALGIAQLGDVEAATQALKELAEVWEGAAKTRAIAVYEQAVKAAEAGKVQTEWTWKAR